jgi:hypothetical protein
VKTSEAANLPRWRGQPGFFEIWFLVLFAPGAARAWWLRYTLFAPARGLPGTPRATVWAAAYDAGRMPPVVAMKRILPIETYRAAAHGFAVHLADAELGNGLCRGEVSAGGHRIAWQLRFTPAAHEVRRTPWLVHHLPLPTRVAHANHDVAFSGSVEVDGTIHTVDAAPGLQKHIWGTRRVEELTWLFCPGFAGEPGPGLEATSASLRRGQRPLTSIWARSRHEVIDLCGFPAVLRNRIERTGELSIAVRGESATRAVRGRAWCEPDSLAGYVYRDPSGADLHVAQSDLASCELEILARAHPFRPWRPIAQLGCRQTAALEFHGPEALPGVRYIAWDGETPA